MGKRIVLGVLVALGLLVWSGLADEVTLTVTPDTIYIGQSVQVTYAIPTSVKDGDTLIVLNLNSLAVREFKVQGKGSIDLYFLRPCDDVPKDTSAESVFIANPGDEVLFILKKSAVEKRVKVDRSTDGPNYKLEKGKIVVTYPAADLTCDKDPLYVEFFVQKPENACTIELKETKPGTGEFEIPIDIKYVEEGEKGKFVVRYSGKDAAHNNVDRTVEVELPNTPVANIIKITRADQKEVMTYKELPLVKDLNQIPDERQKSKEWKNLERVYLDSCSRPCGFAFVKQRIQRDFNDPKPEVYVVEVKKELYVVIKDDLEYYFGKMENTEVFGPVELVIELVIDGATGVEVDGGRLEANKTYRIKARNCSAHGLILIIDLNSGQDVSKDVSKDVPQDQYDEALQVKVMHWKPDSKSHKGKTFAIVYIDEYSCTLPILIVYVSEPTSD